MCCTTPPRVCIHLYVHVYVHFIPHDVHTYIKKDVVLLVIHSRGHYTPLRFTVPPLQALHSLACSVTSLSLSPCHQLPGHHHLHNGALAGCLLGWDESSTWLAGHAVVSNNAPSSPHSGYRRTLPLPATVTHFADTYIVRIPFGDHPLKLERYREDSHGPCARMTRTNREV